MPLCLGRAGQFPVAKNSHIHAGGNLREFLHILYNYRKTIVEYLDSTGILRPGTVVGHMVFMADHPRVDYPESNEREILARSGASVGHCAYKYAKMSIALESFDRFVAAGVNMGLGTDTYPLDIVSEMRYASILSKIVDKKAYGGRARDVFNAATVGGANALGRADLGRISEGAKADLVTLDLRTPRYGLIRDPITALVEYGSGADVDTVVVNGAVVIKGGTSTRIDESELYARANAGAQKAWNEWQNRDWAGRTVEDINPPAFPTRR